MPLGRLRATLADAVRLCDADTDDVDATVESYLRVVSERAGLIEERAPGVFAFWHQTFEEFLAATNLASNLMTTRERLVAVADDPSWHEVVLLTMGYVGVILSQEEVAGTLVDAIATSDPPPSEALLHSRLALAGACISDDIRAPKNVIENVLVSLAAAAAQHPRATLVAQLTASLRSVARQGLVPSEHLAEALRANTTARSWRLRLETARLLANAAQRGRAYALSTCNELLDDSDRDVAWHAARALAMAGSHDSTVVNRLAHWSNFLDVNDAEGRALLELPVFEALTSAEADGTDAAKLLIAIHAVGERVEAILLQSILSATDEPLTRAVDRLIQLGCREGAIAALMDRARKGDIIGRVNAVLELVRVEATSSDVVSALIEDLSEPFEASHVQAASRLARAGYSAPTVDALLAFGLYAPEYNVSRDAAEALVLGGRASVVAEAMGSTSADPFLPLLIPSSLLAEDSRSTLRDAWIAGLERLVATGDDITAVIAGETLIEAGHRNASVVGRLYEVVDTSDDFAAATAARALAIFGEGANVVTRVGKRIARLLDDYLADTLVSNSTPSIVSAMLELLDVRRPGSWSAVSQPEWTALADGLSTQGDELDRLRAVAVDAIANMTSARTGGRMSLP
jgi:hypothetical protein